MTTALTVKSFDFPALSKDSRQAQIIAANLDGEPISEQDLTRVPTPAGGSTTWSIDVAGNQETTDEIQGLLVGIGRRGVLWPKSDPSEMRPVIVTHDLLVGYRVSDELGDIDERALEKFRIGERRYDWVALSSSPEFGYGTSKSGSGKKVKESRLLAMLRVDRGEIWPLLVTVGPGSLQRFNKWRKTGLPDFHYACVVGLRLEKVKNAAGQAYSQIAPRVVGTIPVEQAEVVKRLYAEPLKAMFDAPPAIAGAAILDDEE